MSGPNFSLQFLGAAGEVTGSKTLLTTHLANNTHHYLIDCGLFQGAKSIRELNWQDLSFAKLLKGVILTHAHVDHSGLLPRLSRFGFNAPIYVTPDTAKLLPLLLRDSAKLNVEEANYHARKKTSVHQRPEPLFTEEDVENILGHIVIVPFETQMVLDENISFYFHWAGHIMGASFVEFKILNETIVFSGDLGHERQPLLEPPTPLIPCDYLILESTYGNRIHEKVNQEDEIDYYLQRIFQKSPTAVVLIPAFAVGRTQDVLYLLKKLEIAGKLPPVPIYLDGPMSTKAVQLFEENKNCRYFRPIIRQEGNQTLYPSLLKIVEDFEQSKALNELTGPMIILSSSGMLDGGRILHHLKHRIEDQNNAILFTGFVAPGTRGDQILRGEKTITIYRESLEVNCMVYSCNSQSAHGDYLDLTQWIGQQRPKLIILNHGRSESMNFFKNYLANNFHQKVTQATPGESFQFPLYE